MSKDFIETAQIKPGNFLIPNVSKESSEERALHTNSSYNTGDVLCTFEAAATSHLPSRHTVQVGENTHIILNPSFLRYINHSCSPNVFFDTATFQLICLRRINAGDELTFFYPSSEWIMSNPFNCHCGSPVCIKQVMGANYLGTEILKRYKLTDFIEQKLRGR